MERSTARAPFALKPVAAAAALAAGAAWAAPTPNQMPGAGFVSAVSLGSTTVLGATFTNLVSGANIPVDGKVVIQWAGAGAPAGEVTNPHGFNLGSNAVLGFTAASAKSAVLNIDASGNPSQIYGLLLANAKAGWIPAMFVANANGIVVGAGGRIVAPQGVGLIGANLNNATSINEFTGNNGWVVPAAPSYGNSYVSFGAVPATGNVSIAGAINGDQFTNTPAQYILVAGNNVDVLNTGNLFGLMVELDAGVIGSSRPANVNGVSGVTVNRLWDVDSGTYESCCIVGAAYGDLQLAAGATGNVINEGSISAAGFGPNEWIAIQAKGNVRSGIAGDTDTQVGLFSDQGIYIDSYSNTGKVELYNVVSGYTTNKTLPFMHVNFFAYMSGFRPDVTIDAITRGAQPSSIATTEEVLIYGGDVSILSTVNHKANSAGGTQGDYNLFIDGSTSVNVAGSVGAGHHVLVNSNGPLTVSGNVLSDTDGASGGGIYVVNIGAGAPTTISGNLTVPPPWGSWIYVATRGPLTIAGNLGNASGFVDVRNEGTGAGNFTDISGNIISGNGIHVGNGLSAAPNPLTISGNLTSGPAIVIDNYGTAPGNATTISGNVTSTGGDVYVNHFGSPTGMLTVSGSLSAWGDVEVFSAGHARIGTLDAGFNILATVRGTSLAVDGPWTAGDYLRVDAPLATTRLTPAGVLTAPSVDLVGLHFTGVNAAGLAYANLGEKPAAQIVTNELEVILTGSINAPLAPPPPPPPDGAGAPQAATLTNWLDNSMDVAPLATLAPVSVTVSANGGGFQAVNLRVLGDALVWSGTTATPFIGVPLTTGGLPAGGIQGNLGSQLILQADGYMQVQGSPTGSLFGPPVAFQWPGGAVFKAGTTLQTFAPVYNAWSTDSPPFGGVFFDAPYIALGGYLATSGTAWANFSSQPVSGDPAVFQIRQTSPTSFGFEATTAFVKNAYSSTVTGGAVCTTTGPTTWAACP